MKITVGIPTKNRYDSLCLTLLSIAMQTLRPEMVIIVDDTDPDKRVDIRTLPNYAYILRLFDDYNIKWHVLFGQGKGQHYSHQMVQDTATTKWIFRIDDDEVAEPTCLQTLSFFLQENTGAVAPRVLMPNPEKLPAGISTNSIKQINQPNVQWFKWEGTKKVEHLYSCFLYRKGITQWDLNLSTVAHREETIFTHQIFRAGYDLFVVDATVWHFRQDTGGIRTQRDPLLWEHDEKIFQGYLQLWNADDQKKMIVLDNGLGDHFCFKKILNKVKQKYKKIVIAACFPEVFQDEEVELISIAEAKLMFGNIENFSIYKYMTDHRWDQSLVKAFESFYL